MLAILISCIFAPIIGLGLCHRTVTPNQIPESFAGVSRDRWIQDEAIIRFPELASLPHQILINFGDWQAIKGGAPLLRTKSCSGSVVETLLTPDALVQRFRLEANCRELTLSFPNAPVASTIDRRRIGAQFLQIRITSAIGIPIFSASYYLNWLALILALCASAAAAVWRFRLNRALLFVSPFALTIFAALAQPARLFELQSLLAAASLILIGIAASPAHDDILGQARFGLSNRIANFLLVGILVIGTALRLYGITFGLPELFHTDEGIKVNVMKRMLTKHTLDPNYFLHPTLLLYLSLAAHKLLQLFHPQLSLDESLILSGRIISTIAGVVSIFFLYKLTDLLYSRGTALLAAALLATSPLAVTCSRYLKEDSLFCMFLLLTTWLTVLAVQKRSTPLLYLAGIVTGICASSKYTGALAGALVLAAPWMVSARLAPDRKVLRDAIFSLALIPVGFLLGSPYAALNCHEFFGGLHSEHRHMLQGHHGYIDPWSHFWAYHLTRSIEPALTLPVFLVALVSVGLFICRAGMRELLILGVLLLIYLPAEWVKAKPAPQPERYILGCIPFLAIVLAEGITRLAPRRSELSIFACGLLLMVFPFARTISLAAEINNDTRTQMTRWITENISPSSAILVEARYAPKLTATPHKKHRVDVRESHMAFQLSRLKHSSFDYLLITSFSYDRYFTQAGTDPNLRRIYSQIFSSLKLEKEFSPQFGSYGFHNPTVRLYRIGENAKGASLDQ